MAAARPSLNFASILYDRMQALHSGEVKIEGVDLNFIVLQHPRDIFDRMVGGYEFDASELSLSEHICRYAAGHRDFVAIPVFPSRAFRHGFIAVNSNTIKKPTDLNGKKIGVQRYTMTAAVWIRTILKDHGVDLSTIEWVEGAMDGPGRHGWAGASMPLHKHVNIAQKRSDKSLSQLLEEGEIDATIGADLPGCFGKAQHVKRLFPDFMQAEKQYYREKGIFPIMHTIVIRTPVLDKLTFLATSLYNALDSSKEVARIRMRFLDCLRYMLPWLPSDIDEIESIFPNGDPWVNGINDNRKALEALIEALHDQGMIKEKPDLYSLFVPVRGNNWKVGWGTTSPTCG